MNLKGRMNTVQSRLSLGFALLLAMLLIMAGTVIYESHRISSVELEHQKRAANLAQSASGLEIDLLNLETSKRGYLLIGRKEFLQSTIWPVNSFRAI